MPLQSFAAKQNAWAERICSHILDNPYTPSEDKQCAPVSCFTDTAQQQWYPCPCFTFHLWYLKYNISDIPWWNFSKFPSSLCWMRLFQEEKVVKEKVKDPESEEVLETAWDSMTWCCKRYFLQDLVPLRQRALHLHRMMTMILENFKRPGLKICQCQ